MIAPLLLLLAEDEDVIRMLLEDELETAGFELVAVPDGTTALAEIELDASRFRGLITDIHLGKGPSGWELARRARELSPNLAVIYISGDSGHEWTAQGVPGSVMIPKPFVPVQVITALSTLLNQADLSHP